MRSLRGGQIVRINSSFTRLVDYWRNLSPVKTRSGTSDCPAHQARTGYSMKLCTTLSLFRRSNPGCRETTLQTEPSLDEEPIGTKARELRQEPTSRQQQFLKQHFLGPIGNWASSQPQLNHSALPEPIDPVRKYPLPALSYQSFRSPVINFRRFRRSHFGCVIANRL